MPAYLAHELPMIIVTFCTIISRFIDGGSRSPGICLYSITACIIIRLPLAQTTRQTMTTTIACKSVISQMICCLFCIFTCAVHTCQQVMLESPHMASISYGQCAFDRIIYSVVISVIHVDRYHATLSTKIADSQRFCFCILGKGNRRVVNNRFHIS